MANRYKSSTVSGKTARLSFSTRRYLPYDDIVQDLKNHKGTFVEGVKPQTASRALKKLANMGYDADAIPTKNDGKKGYVFALKADIDALFKDD